MLNLRKIRDLTLRAPSAPSRPRHLSAASGLVAAGSFLYVVADDEHHLGVFPAAGDAPGELIRIIEGDLPDDKDQRKRLKPDLEALLLLPPFTDCTHGALLALGSGSKRHRRQGVLLALDEQSRVKGSPRLIDLSPLLDPIRDRIGKLNIEGAVLTDDRMILLQRGNKGGELNALISLDRSDVQLALASGNVMGAFDFEVRGYDLGSIDGIPLTFTDGATLPDGRIVFTAVAEDTEDSYADGACVGAAVGIVAADGRLLRLERLSPGAKIEGIDARIVDGRIQLLLVSDADDARIPASLFAAELA